LLVSLRAELAKIFSRNGTLPELTSDGQPPSSARTPELVFFQHDEVIVHCPREQAESVAGAVARAGNIASRLVFGPTTVAFPLNTAVVDCYADAK
jgi:DNA polymerase-1